MFVRTESFSQFLRFYPIISVIVFIHIALYLVSALPIFPQLWVYEQLAGVNLFIKEGEWWRLVSPIFVHLGFAHLLFNSFSLVLFGPPLEKLLGKAKFIGLYLASGVFANIITYVIKPLTYSHVGASGAIFGLFGFYIAMILLKNHFITRESRQIIIPIVVIGVIMTFMQSGINITAHIFGLIGGFVIGWISGEK
ncbi:rhomboid family intramembrane serine protease [Rossellomorea aquimaris]|uniref:Rhomboid family intramembrane serine protease n=1 Tax=Rossellomorea aquimaris TaxID=189382 RepID=A0A5D4TSD3_9BACI|nr:rhomboid family intramembrane serine protease [Rossellomorea aquimaris]TYS74048.1 rhomboid family intramembrane serine protease [Rossellomorea aquimaris]TYS78627.1 rhomboid family intramembrane serine protease [Rossellomorea aquimaris]